MSYENKALRDLARGAPCMFGLDGCDRSGETSVWVHSDEQRHGKGTGQKASDYFGAIGCASCHAALPNLQRMVRIEMMRYAMDETLAYLWTNGLIQVTGSKPRQVTPARTPKILPRKEYRR